MSAANESNWRGQYLREPGRWHRFVEWLTGTRSPMNWRVLLTDYINRGRLAEIEQYYKTWGIPIAREEGAAFGLMLGAAWHCAHRQNEIDNASREMLRSILSEAWAQRGPVDEELLTITTDAILKHYP
jgi:hypothetical protein